MSNKIVFPLLALLLSISCSSFRQSSPEKVSPPISAKPFQKRPTSPLKHSSTLEGNAVWHLIYPAEITLVLGHLRTQTSYYVHIETTLSDMSLLPGLWEVKSVIVNGVEYSALDGGVRHQFDIKANIPSYVGSFILECPGVRKARLAQTRSMEFFDRFRFTSNQGPCEMIVGSEIRKVRKTWSRIKKIPGGKLIKGF